MKNFTFTLNIEVDAHDEEEALVIANALKRIITSSSSLSPNPYKLNGVEIDDLEEL